jgi:tellurite resistance protein TerC
MSIFHYIRHGLVVILMFVGVKMLLTDIFHIPIGYSLGFIAGTLAIAVVASIMRPHKVEMAVTPEKAKDKP